MALDRDGEEAEEENRKRKRRIKKERERRQGRRERATRKGIPEIRKCATLYQMMDLIGVS